MLPVSSKEEAEGPKLKPSRCGETCHLKIIQDLVSPTWKDKVLGFGSEYPPDSIL